MLFAIINCATINIFVQTSLYTLLIMSSRKISKNRITIFKDISHFLMHITKLLYSQVSFSIDPCCFSRYTYLFIFLCILKQSETWKVARIVIKNLFSSLTHKLLNWCSIIPETLEYISTNKDILLQNHSTTNKII